MKDGIRVVVADASADFCRFVCDRINCENDMSAVGYAYDGKQAVELCAREKPDVLVMDVVLSELDGIAVIRTLKEMEIAARVIVVSGFFNDRVAARLSQLDVDWMMPKPCSLNVLVDRIRESVKDIPIDDDCEFETDISEALLEFGMMPDRAGFSYSGIAIKKKMENPDVVSGITKILYPEIGKMYSTNSQNVERCIREEICNAWKNGSAEMRERYFGSFVKYFDSRPTNRRFISLMAEFVSRKRREQFREDEQVNVN